MNRRDFLKIVGIYPSLENVQEKPNRRNYKKVKLPKGEQITVQFQDQYPMIIPKQDLLDMSADLEKGLKRLRDVDIGIEKYEGFFGLDIDRKFVRDELKKRRLENLKMKARHARERKKE